MNVTAKKNDYENVEPFVTAWSEIHKYESLSDERIIKLIKSGDKFAQDYLINKYKNLVKSKARSYFLIGSDKEDIIQEGMIGLYKAIRDYHPEKLASFHNFADLCITRQIITAVKMATRQKHIPLNSSISLNKPIFENESEQTSFDMLPSEKMSNPEELYISQEERRFIEERLSEILSTFECKVLIYYLQKKSYTEIAELLQKPQKSIDNALQRVKKKITKLIDETHKEWQKVPINKQQEELTLKN